MEINKAYIAVGLIVAFSLFFGLAAHASESDQATTITFSQPVEIPGQVLAAGTYFFKLASSGSGTNVVQIFRANSSVLLATLETIATDRPEPTDHTALVLAKQGAGQPDVLLKWFYPGLVTGNEFMYPADKEKELTQEKQQTIVTNRPTVSDSDATGAGN
jgi:hypothetical protein